MTAFDLPYRCPLCTEPVNESSGGFECVGCGIAYPVVAGVPDFRIEPDPWIGIDEDREKARRLEEATRGKGFEETVRAYWAMTPDTPRERAEHFTAHVLRAEERSREWLEALGLLSSGAAEGVGDATGEPEVADGGPWLDVGCGTADLAAAAGEDCEVVGIDVALRWLVAARKRLDEAGVSCRLVCANAEHLPFASRSFGKALSLGTLEHCEDKIAVLEEVHRVLRPGAPLYMRTVNRFTLTREPHVGLFGVGFLPRSWADSYVRWRSGTGYEHHHPAGRRRLRQGLERTGFREVKVGPARSLPSETRDMGPAGRMLLPMYRIARNTPGLEWVIGAVAPLLDIEGMKAA